MAITRKEFLTVSLGFGATALVGSGLFSGCGEDDPPESIESAENCSANGAHDSAISANHGHTLTVPAADVTAGAQKDYDIKGTSSHSHIITLTAAQFAQLATNSPLTITSTTDNGHSHSVTVSCV